MDCIEVTSTLGCLKKTDGTTTGVAIVNEYRKGASGQIVLYKTRYVRPDGTVVALAPGETVSVGQCPTASGGLVFIDTLDPNDTSSVFSLNPNLTAPSAALAQKIGFTYVAADGTEWYWNGTNEYFLNNQVQKVKVKNPNATLMLRGKVVFASTNPSGSKPEIIYASNASEATSSKVLGLIQTTIGGNDTGWVVEAGEMRADTAAF